MESKSTINSSRKLPFTIISLSTILLFISIISAEAATLSIPKIQGKKGEMVSVPVEIKEAKGIAGLKFTFVYPKDILSYKNYKVSPLIKDKQVLLNSREPGQLILVMAGAEGIKEKEGILVTFDFDVIVSDVIASKESNIRPVVLGIEKVEILDEKIKPVPFTIENGILELK